MRPQWVSIEPRLRTHGSAPPNPRSPRSPTVIPSSAEWDDLLSRQPAGLRFDPGARANKTFSSRKAVRPMSSSQLNWPRVRRRNDGDGPKAFILGPLVEDYPTAIDATRADLALALSQGVEKLRCEWRSEEAVVGG